MAGDITREALKRLMSRSQNNSQPVSPACKGKEAPKPPPPAVQTGISASWGSVSVWPEPDREVTAGVTVTRLAARS